MQVALVLLRLCCFHLFVDSIFFFPLTVTPFLDVRIFNGKSFQQHGYLKELCGLGLLFVPVFAQPLPTGETT